MRYIRYACIAVFGLALVLIALANRQTVEVNMLPPELAKFFALTPSYTVPLFVIMFGGILAGLIIGFIWEWIREAKERAAAARQAREMDKLRAEVKRLKGEKNEGKDDVLVLLDEAS